MFTGLIATVGTLKQASPLAKGRLLSVQCPDLAPSLKIGDSVAVNGVCLTVTELTAGGFAAQAVGDTLTKTTLEKLPTGSLLNLEPALAAGSKLDGHLVSGHVNGKGRVVSWNSWGEARMLELTVPNELKADIVPEGSLAVDGISLTVAEVAGNRIRLSIIPHTQSHTNLAGFKPGQEVNLETDLLVRLRGRSRPEGLTLEKLREWGY